MILFTGIYFNNPHFIGIQLKTLRAHVSDDFEFACLDDSEDSTQSIISGKQATVEIKEECERLDVKYIRIPQWIHNNISKGGLVPDGLPASHGTERHRASLHWILLNHKELGFDKYDTLVLGDSDVIISKHMNVSQYMEDYDFVGAGRSGRFTKTNTNYWPDRLSAITEVDIKWYPMYVLFINMKRVNNLEKMNIGGFAGTDTGGQNSFFFDDNPQYKCCFLDIGGERDYQTDFFYKTNNSINEAEMIHFRGGTNWDVQSTDYYKEKLHRFLLFTGVDFPEFKTNQNQDLTSRDGEHTFYR